MEDYELTNIKANLPELIDNTNCSVALLANLEAREILCREEVEIVASKTTNREKACKMFDILQTKVDGYKTMVFAFKETNQTGVLSVLSNINIRKKTGKPIWNIPDRIDTFHGRKSELKQLNSWLQDNHALDNCDFPDIILIHGTAAVGKTVLAVNAIHQYAEENLNTVAAANFNFQNEQTIKQDLENVSSTCFQNSCRDINDIFDYVRNHQIKCVLLYDNCNHKCLLEKMLPRPTLRKRAMKTNWPYPKIIITTQIRCLDTSIRNRLEVKVFSDSESITYAGSLKQFKGYDRKTIQNTCKILGNHPLAIELVSKDFIENMKHEKPIHAYSIGDDWFLRKPPGIGEGYHLSLEEAWNTVFNEIKQNRVWTILKILGFLGCSLDVFKFLEEVEKYLSTNVHLDIQECKRILMQLSIIYKQHNDYYIPGIIQMVLQQKYLSVKHNVLETVLEWMKLLSGKSVGVDPLILYDTWKHASYDKVLVKKYFIPYKTTKAYCTPFHVFVDRNDYHSMEAVFQQTRGTSFGLIDPLKRALMHKDCPSILVRSPQKQQQIIRALKTRYDIQDHGDVVIIKASSQKEQAYVVFMALLCIVLVFCHWLHVAKIIS